MQAKAPTPFWKQVLAVFIVALVGYALCFAWLEHRRHHKGPWRVTFASSAGVLAIMINQPVLKLTNVTIRFPGVTAPTNLPQTITFDPGRPAPFELPFGKCVFIDALFLPGTATCEMFGHQVQLMPRTLTIDRAERPWRSGEVIELTPRPESKSPAGMH